MDRRRFARLTLALMTAGSRRGLLAGVTSGLLAVVPLALGGEDAAAKKKHKKHKKKQHGGSPPAPSPLPPPGRGPQTRSFANTSSISIPGSGTSGLAAPYPATIAVNGLTNGSITDVNVTLTNLSHPFPDDLDLLLVAPSGTNTVIMSDAGNNFPTVNLNLTLDDSAAAPLPDAGALSSGTYRPTNNLGFDGTDVFPPPAPAPGGNVQFSSFNGQNPNGTWQLFIIDDSDGDGGTLAAGWSLQITAVVDLPAATASRRERVRRGSRRRAARSRP